jgi:hypothetical protein
MDDRCNMTGSGNHLNQIAYDSRLSLGGTGNKTFKRQYEQYDNTHQYS